jgi:peptide deformylase
MVVAFGVARVAGGGYSAGVILEIVKYGHPVLREKGRRIESVSEEVRRLAADMVETMYAANGVGLAAQQVGRPLMLTVLDVRDSELPSELIIEGEAREVASFMPLMLINPVLSELAGEQVGTEGCLSIPDISADVSRAARVRVSALNLDGNPIRFVCTGLLARAVQHEVDHLNGVLFIDHLGAADRVSLAGKLRKLQQDTEAALARDGQPPRAVARL